MHIQTHIKQRSLELGKDTRMQVMLLVRVLIEALRTVLSYWRSNSTESLTEILVVLRMSDPHEESADDCGCGSVESLPFE